MNELTMTKIGKKSDDSAKNSKKTSIPQILAHQHHHMAARLTRIAQEMHIAANAVRRIAVVTGSVGVARRIDVESHGISG